MGEAKRRAKEISLNKERETAWRDSLTTEERIILDLAEQLDQKLVRGQQFSEGCYHLAFFMTRYLSIKGINVTPIIGWVCDGLWKGASSHAWIEYGGKKTDVSLTYTTHPEAQPTGALIVHDHVLRKGKALYAYYKNDDPIVIERLEWLRSVPEFKALVSHKEQVHRTMLEIASTNRFQEYLANAPLGGRYDDIARLIE